MNTLVFNNKDTRCTRVLMRSKDLAKFYHDGYVLQTVYSRRVISSDSLNRGCTSVCLCKPSRGYPVQNGLGKD